MLFVETDHCRLVQNFVPAVHTILRSTKGDKSCVHEQDTRLYERFRQTQPCYRLCPAWRNLDLPNDEISSHMPMTPLGNSSPSLDFITTLSSAARPLLPSTEVTARLKSTSEYVRNGLDTKPLDT